MAFLSSHIAFSSPGQDFIGPSTKKEKCLIVNLRSAIKKLDRLGHSYILIPIVIFREHFMMFPSFSLLHLMVACSPS